MTGRNLSGTITVMKSPPFFSTVVKGAFLGRPNRFIVECRVKNKPIRAYLPNPGRLWELFFPGTVLYLTKRDASLGGKTEFTVVAVERVGIPIMLHTHVNNLVARQLIERGRIPGLEQPKAMKPEFAIGRSRFDFLLDQNGKNVIVEVKFCTLVGDKIAMFPDAVTVRGKRHLLELAELSKSGTKTTVIFIVHWSRARYFMPEHHTDLEFARTLLAVKDDVMVRAVSVGWSRDLMLEDAGRDLIIPWKLVKQEAHDSGSYIVILRLMRDRNIFVGSLGEVRFRKGYYCCVGSARTNLTKSIDRHWRLSKNLQWHIDYLRSEADFHAALPVRASEDMECAIAKELSGIAEWTVPDFGSSDCNCPGHLFGMIEDPVHTPSFIKVLQYFRIDRLEKYLGND